MPMLDELMLAFVFIVAGGFLLWFVKEARSDDEK